MRFLSSFFGLVLLTSFLHAQDQVDYLRDIKPILKDRCFSCHGALKQKAKLRLDTGSLIHKGGRSGPAVVSGKPEKSSLIERITAADEAERMPPEGKPLTERQIALIKRWIAQGAKSPAGEKAETDPRTHWAFQKPVRPAVPKVNDAAWSRNPIDAFLAAEHAKHKLTPSPAADKTTLLRRVYLDLIGLPPTRTEVEAFLQDGSPDAFEKVVDRLLESPHYAERWARHWMDVWRYSDWYGRRAVPDVLHSYGQIWRWRDWIVKSVADDKPYDRMILEMLAGDEIAPNDEQTLVATGFIVRNFFRWNYNLWKKDLVEHTGKAFLGLTLNCCHCHDHKYDPISKEEYFQFRAFFEPIEIRHDRWPGDADPGPYPKYNYGSAYGPIKSGMVRIFDESLDAKTYMYSGGDHRNKIDGKPPIAPSPLEILGGQVNIAPVDLPLQAFYPALKDFVVKEELAKRADALAKAEKALLNGEMLKKKAQEQFQAANPQTNVDAHAKLKLAVEQGLQTWLIAFRQRDLDQAELVAYQARLDAEKAMYLEKVAPLRQKELNQAANLAERRRQLQVAQLNHAQVVHALAVAEQKSAADPKAKVEVQALQKKKAAADVDLLAKEKLAAAPPAETYAPLGPKFPPKSSGRRTALARWIANKDNPLTARVAVNYLWSWHFGRPIVEPTFDLGRNGKPPSHPALLDWLALEFMDQGWKIKPLHRLLVTSQAYRMRSGIGDGDNPNLVHDPDNRFLWRFPTQRLEAEMVRDCVLYLAGELDITRGGPDIPHEQGLTSKRRSIYFTHHGEGRMQFLELFDAANACECYQRNTSVMPQQALALGNSELTLRHSRILARKLAKELGLNGDAEERFICAAFEQVLARPPSIQETKVAHAFLARQVKLFQDSGIKTTPAAAASQDGPSTDASLRARENLVHALFNHNDFVTIR